LDDLFSYKVLADDLGTIYNSERYLGSGDLKKGLGFFLTPQDVKITHNKRYKN